MTKTVVVLQSNYIPWKGYFDLIRDADLFIFYDDVQYTKNDWRSRNKIKTPLGAEWITIPAGSGTNRLICEVELKTSIWQKKHWKTLQQNYGRCTHFGCYREFFEHFYLDHPWVDMSEMNQYLIKYIATEFLGIDTMFADSREYSLSGKKLNRLLDLTKKVGATRYISGPSAKDYIDQIRFGEEGIDLVFKDYSGYPEYSQNYPPFEHGVSVLDLLFNLGPETPWYVWGWREEG